MKLGPLLRDRRLVSGVVLVSSAVIGMLVFRSADAASQRVVAASRDIAWGEAIAPSDLAVVSVDDPAARQLVAAERRDSLAGLVATRRLPAGTLLRASDVAAPGPA